jgi:hypothetical protein
MLAHDPTLRLSLGHEARREAMEVPWERRFPELEAALLDAASGGIPGHAAMLGSASAKS